MSFLGVKVILFWVIPLIIKEKSNASALASTVVNTSNDRYEHEQRSMRHDFLNAFPRFLTCFRTTFTRFSGCYYHNISEQIF